MDLDEQPYDPPRPVVCVAETSKPVLAATRTPVPAQPAHPERHDYEYQRHGVRQLFLFCAPPRGWRPGAVTARRTAQDFAQPLKGLLDEPAPEAPVVRVVLDNLNTPTPAALYETLAPAEAQRRRRRREFPFTPKQASGLNRAEIECAAYTPQGLDRRIPDADPLSRELNALTHERNAAQATSRWRFTCQEARVKLSRLYPSLSG